MTTMTNTKNTRLLTSAYASLLAFYLFSILLVFAPSLEAVSISSIALTIAYGASIILFITVYLLNKSTFERGHAKYQIVTFLVLMISILLAIIFSTTLATSAESVSGDASLRYQTYTIVAWFTVSLVVMWSLFRNVKGAIFFFNKKVAYKARIIPISGHKGDPKDSSGQVELNTYQKLIAIIKRRADTKKQKDAIFVNPQDSAEDEMAINIEPKSFVGPIYKDESTIDIDPKSFVGPIYKDEIDKEATPKAQTKKKKKQKKQRKGKKVNKENS